MSTKSSTVPVNAWNWVIQALSKFKQVDSSTLVGMLDIAFCLFLKLLIYVIFLQELEIHVSGLVKKAPAISDDLGKDAREMLSLRILESLFIHGSDEATVDPESAENAKISFDPSEHCEDVLHKILDEFKEALLEGSHPLLSTLRERSKVGAANVSENTSYMADVNIDAQTTVAEDDLASQNPSNGNNKLQESLLQKSNKLDNFTRRITEHIGREEHETSIGSPVKGLGENMLIDHVEYTVSKKVEQSCGNANTEHGQQQPPGDNGSTPQDTCREGQEKTLPIDSMKGLEFGGEPRDCKNDTLPNVSNSGPSGEGKKSMEKDSQLETGSGSERSDDERTDSESDDERTDIAAKKEAFLSSQCTLSQDTMAMNDCTEICLCMRCNKGGQLLVCRSNACPFRVHESCMGSTATLDENGKFYCPFCAYSRSISTYLLVKKKASLARKDLQAFLSLGVEHRQKISSKRGAGLETNETRQIGASGESFVVYGNGDTVSRGKEDSPHAKLSCGEEETRVSNAEHPMLAEPSRLCVSNELHCGDKGVSVGSGSLRKRGGVEKEVGEVSRPLTRMEAHKIGENAAIHSDNGYLNQPTTDSLYQPLHQPRMPKADYNENESPASDVSNHSRRSYKQKSPYTSPTIPLLGRKKLQWTKSEEEILKEGVQRLWSIDNKRIPWREILSFGEGVFHKSRTAIDLKDKWRNICKGSPAAKKPKL
ncbi:Homeodomain-like protein [Cynara cardunculus var. scolymus]|uniref:Homeodomain-like protein n=1 Tax=Cynara cardunculus var. scolymus TaxID=59895 RepID=A0A118JW23_CYNCS|nr:Homeodomain-like protein [Cynara cardunculus var. scolymus]